MPARQDFERLVEWCDRQPPFGFLESVAGVALERPTTVEVVSSDVIGSSYSRSSTPA
jgi:hypothetical protein